MLRFFSLIHASLRCELFRACGVWTMCVAMDEMRARGTQHNSNNVVGRRHCDIWRFVRRSTSIHNLRGESQENKLCMHNRSKRKTSRSNARRKKKKGSHAKDKRNKNLTTKIQTILGPIYIFVRVLESFFLYAHEFNMLLRWSAQYLSACGYTARYGMRVGV